MTGFFSSKYAGLVPYTPGEQPQDKKYIKLNTNESPFPPSPYAQMFARREAGELQLYSDPDMRALRATAAEKLGVDTDEIVFTNGSDEILNFAFAAFCDSGKRAVFADITYGFYKVFARLNCVPYTEIPLDGDFRINVEDYIGCSEKYGPCGAVFIANPNAPTGIALPLADIEKIVASNPDSVVVIDEAYVDFGGESAVCLRNKYKNLLVTQTFSKSRSLAGARLGYGIACRELISDINTIRFSTNPYNVNRMTMAAGTGALTDTEYFGRNVAEIALIRNETADKLRKIGFTLTDSKTNFIFAKHEKIDGKELYLALKEKGILVRHFDSPRISAYNRITIGNREQMDAFVAAVTEIIDEKK